MRKRWDVLGIGNAAVDDLVYLRSFPQPDSKQSVVDLLRQGGGLTATALVAAARQGASAAFCAALGMDDLSIYTLAELEREGVDCSAVQRVNGARPYYSIILVDMSSGQRTILKQRGEMLPAQEAITPELVRAARVLLVDHLLPSVAIRAAQIARADAMAVVADVEADTFEGHETLLPLVDHLIVGAGVAGRLTGLNDPRTAAAALAGAQARACVAVTAGADGVYFSVEGGAVEHIAALRVRAVDTTGCGDVFHGAYAAALARGERVADALALANVSAGLKTLQPGGRLGIPDLATAQKALAEG